MVRPWFDRCADVGEEGDYHSGATIIGCTITGCAAFSAAGDTGGI
jgi:hypothetical protein